MSALKKVELNSIESQTKNRENIDLENSRFKQKVSKPLTREIGYFDINLGTKRGQRESFGGSSKGNYMEIQAEITEEDLE